MKNNISSFLGIGLIVALAIFLGASFWHIGGEDINSEITKVDKKSSGDGNIKGLGDPINPVAVDPCGGESKACPDGSEVGRIGPNCEFAECPTVDIPVKKTVDLNTYINEKYGFKINLTNDWNGYIVKEEKTDWKKFESFRFCIPTTSGKWSSEDGWACPMTILVYDYDEWNDVMVSDGYKPGYMGGNENYVFGLGLWQDCPEDLCDLDLKLNEMENFFEAY